MFPRTTILFVFVLSFYLTHPATGESQAAWVPAADEGSVTIVYQNLDARDHINFQGRRSNLLGAVHAHTAIVDFEYGITDRLALNADLAYVASRYKGPVPEGPSDDGLYHPAFQDLHVHIRYKLIKTPLVITPFVGVTLPTHNYQALGHSAIGRHFRELLVGVAVGKQLGPRLPNLYVHGVYAQSIMKRFEGFNVNRANAEWEVGWAATERLTARFIGFGQRSFGGFNLPVDLHSEEDHEIHDRVARANFIRLGVGGSFSVSKSFEINFDYARTVWGRNIHAIGGVVMGMTWRFSRGFGLRKMSTRINHHPGTSLTETTF